MDKFLITGGSGFIAYHLAEKLSSNKCKIYLIDKFKANDKYFKNLLKKKNIFFIKKKLDKNLNFLDQYKFNFVFHLAASVGVKNINTDPFSSYENNIVSTLNLVNYLNKKKFNGKLIFFSTSEIYQNSKVNLESLKLNINSSTSKRDAYFLSKLFCEKLLYFSKLNFIILRPHNIYGPRMGNKHVIPNLYEKAKGKNSNFQVFSSSHKRCFCYIKDAIDQIIFLTFKKNLKNRIFNIGNPKESVSIYNLAKIILSFTNANKKLIKMPNEPGSPKIRIPSIKNILNENYKPTFTKLMYGLKKTISYYEKNSN